jgi:hypothetical protein
MNHGIRATPLRALVLSWVIPLLLPLLAGCSGFGREWKAAARLPAGADSIAGRWEGTWRSDANGHRGRLRCIMTPQDGSVVEARFRATYAGILSFGYTAPLTVTNEAGVWRFTGEADLGKLAGGVYRYDGTASPTQFHSIYRAQSDHGVFEMQRPTK